MSAISSSISIYLSLTTCRTARSPPLVSPRPILAPLLIRHLGTMKDIEKIVDVSVDHLQIRKRKKTLIHPAFDRRTLRKELLIFVLVYY